MKFNKFYPCAIWLHVLEFQISNKLLYLKKFQKCSNLVIQAMCDFLHSAMFTNESPDYSWNPKVRVFLIIKSSTEDN